MRIWYLISVSFRCEVRDERMREKAKFDEESRRAVGMPSPMREHRVTLAMNGTSRCGGYFLTVVSCVRWLKAEGIEEFWLFGDLLVCRDW